MPFDPKLIHPDEAPLRRDGELDLPDDLSALAEQLGQDAAYLATHYPAEEQPQLALAAALGASAKRIGRRRLRMALLGVSLASIAMIAMALTLSEFRPGVPDAAHRLVTQPGRAPDHGIAVERAMTIPASIPSRSASLSFGELSGPEREALFDLLMQEGDSGSVSF